MFLKLVCIGRGGREVREGNVREQGYKTRHNRSPTGQLERIVERGRTGQNYRPVATVSYYQMVEPIPNRPSRRLSCSCPPPRY